jgi:RHS repeat-associated protein
MTYPNGRVLNFSYNAGLDNAISRLSFLSDNSGPLEAYTYLGLGTVVQRAHPQNGVNLTYIHQSGDNQANTDGGDQYTGLDRFGRVIDQYWIETTGPNTGTAADRFQYSYDQNSNVTARNNLVNPNYSERYTYDGFNQLATFTRTNGHTQNWTYDALGNWNSVTTDNNTQNRTANAQNQYTSVSGGTTPTYDNNGNLTTDPTPTSSNTYVYDAWNRLVTVKSAGNTIASYTYDALNRRITERSSGTTTDLYYNDRWQVIEEQINGKTQTQYVWDPLAIDTLIERDSNPDNSGNLTLRLYAQQDANGNVTALVDTSGNVVERYVYDPFGVVTVLDSNWNTRGSSLYGEIYLFQGLRYEATTGLYYSRERDYSPTLGRFLEQDPLGFDGGDSNLYGYVREDPIAHADPSGLTITITGTAEVTIPEDGTPRIDSGDRLVRGPARVTTPTGATITLQKGDKVYVPDRSKVKAVEEPHQGEPEKGDRSSPQKEPRWYWSPELGFFTYIYKFGEEGGYVRVSMQEYLEYVRERARLEAINNKIISLIAPQGFLDLMQHGNFLYSYYQLKDRFPFPRPIHPGYGGYGNPYQAIPSRRYGGYGGSGNYVPAWGIFQPPEWSTGEAENGT